MNPHILMVIDNQLNPAKYTKEQLKQNADDADNAAAAITAAAYYAADAAADDDAYWLNQYLRYSGENKQDYIDAINKDNK